MKKYLLILLLPLAALSITTAQKSSNSVAQEITTTDKVIYREVGGFGLGSLAFRDFATSPLIYEGLALSLAGGKRKIDTKKETYFSIKGLFGITTVSVEGESDASTLANFNINYSRLYTLKGLSSNNWTYKVGGTVDLLGVFRFNPALRNNSVGFEAFPTLFGSFKIDKDFIRHPFLRKKKPPKRQQLSLAIDVGLINTTFRNGYAYTFHAPFYNGGNFLEDHEFSWFSGFRIRSTLAYTIYSNKNKNGIRFSYSWEGVRSGATPDRFSMATGIFQYTLLHRLN